MLLHILQTTKVLVHIWNNPNTHQTSCSIVEICVSKAFSDHLSPATCGQAFHSFFCHEFMPFPARASDIIHSKIDCESDRKRVAKVRRVFCAASREWRGWERRGATVCKYMVTKVANFFIKPQENTTMCTATVEPLFQSTFCGVRWRYAENTEKICSFLKSFLAFI